MVLVNQCFVFFVVCGRIMWFLMGFVFTISVDAKAILIARIDVGIIWFSRAFSSD